MYRDAGLPGFGVRVSQAGTKTFVLVHGRDRQFVTIGRYPIITLAQARTEAKSLLAKKTLGLLQPKSITFEEAYEKFKTEHVATKRARTQYDYKRTVEKYFLPKLGATRLNKITYETMIEITSRLADTPSEQAHALAVARTFFKWCARPPRRYAPSPLDGLQLTIAKSRKRTLSDEEIIKVWRAAEEQGYPHGTVVRLLLLTGQRRGEIAWLRRPWINQKERTITLPDTVTKSKREHTFPYGDLTAQILAEAPRFNSTELLFPTRWGDDRPFSGFSKYKKEMTDGVPGWTLHDLRRTFATRLAGMKVPPHIVERLLNHKLGGIANKTDGIVSAVADVYNRAAYLPEMREAIEKWETFLASLLEPHRKQAIALAA
jgi:integrase